MSTTFDFTKCKELSRKSFMPRASSRTAKIYFLILREKQERFSSRINWCYILSWIKSNIYYICELGSIYLIQAYSKLENTRSKYSAKGQESYKIISTLEYSFRVFYLLSLCMYLLNTIICNWKWQTVLSRPQIMTYAASAAVLAPPSQILILLRLDPQSAQQSSQR